MKRLFPLLLLLLMATGASALDATDLYIKGDIDFCRRMVDGTNGQIDYLWNSGARAHYFKLTVKHVSDDSSISNDEFEWKASNPAIAVFSENGPGATATLDVKSYGSCTITATDKTKNISTSVNFTSKLMVDPTGISFSPEKDYFVVGEYQKVKVNITPENADYCYFVWNGRKTLETELDVIYSDSGSKEIPLTMYAISGMKLFNTKKFNCVYPILDTQLFWGPSSRSENNEATLMLGTDLRVINKILTIDVYGESSNDIGYSTDWEISDKSVARVNSGYNSCIVEGLKEGSVTLTTTTAPYKTTKELVINVMNGEYVFIDNVSIHSTDKDLESSDFTALTEGQTLQFSATISPENATNKSVYWESSNPQIASVDFKGLVTAKTEGFTRITAQSIDGVSAYVDIYVTPKTGINWHKPYSLCIC